MVQHGGVMDIAFVSNLGILFIIDILDIKVLKILY